MPPRPRAPPPLPSFDRDAKGYVKEADVLHPVDKSRPDGEWPTFEMRNAIVYSKDLTSLEGLLLVEKKGPFLLRGRITIDVTNEDHTQAFLSTRIPRYLDIEVLAMRMSIGYGVTDEGGVPAVWAATNHGFFEVLHATPEYKPVLDKTFEAITLYYTVMDIYEKHEKKGGKRKRRLESDEVLFRYAVDIGEAAVKEEIVDRCHEHAEFMANHFPQDNNFDWTGKVFASFIQGLAKIPRVVNRHPAISQTPVPVPSPSQPVTLPQRSRSTAHEGTAAVPKGRTTRQSSSSASGKSQSPAVALVEPKARRGSSQPGVEPARPAAPSPSLPDSLRSEETALKMYEAILDVSSPTDSISRITIGGITGKLYFKYKFSVYKGAADAMKFYGQELARCMENDSERAAEWRESPIYRDLSTMDHPMEAHELQFLTPAQIDPSLCRRTKLGPAAAQARRKDPIVGEKPGKGPAAAGYRSSSDSSGVGRPRVGRPSGKVASLRLATAVPKKRLQSDYDSAASVGRASKSSKLSHGTGYEDENFGEGSVGMETDREETPDAMVSDSEADQESVRIAIDVEDVPSTQPTGPNGTWVCDQEDCGHVVSDADDAGGQMAVREHLHEHEETSEKVKLAVAEGHATGHRPIEYLLEKLKQIGGRELPNAEDDGRPEPIKRRHGLFF